MAVYRHIHINYWQDGFVLDLTPEEKYFYIYLMTNSKTSQCGIYELHRRIIETETCVWLGMVFQLEPGSSSVMPMLSWQVLSTSGWMN